jgi:GNAT superfamily N-acetyltransferase
MLFGLFHDGKQAGFVAVERAEDSVYYLEKLAVLPEYRNRGYGRQLVSFVIERVRRLGGKKLGLGMWDIQSDLKEWYTGMGFRETSKKELDFLPLTVCFMEMELVETETEETRV